MSILSLRSSPTITRESQLQNAIKSPRTSIHDLDDYSLLHIFYLFRPNIASVAESGELTWYWLGEHWWYKLVQVCRRWRYLVLESASYLRLRLLCTAGTPVADMLTHSPPFPLIIDYDVRIRDISEEDEAGMMLALGHRHRVQCIYLSLHVPSLQNVIANMDNEFPALEYLHIGPPTKHHSHLALPPTLETPALRYLLLDHFASLIGSPMLSTAISLVELGLNWIHPSTYPHPNIFFRQLALLPQLERLVIRFRSPITNRDFERQLLHTPVTIHVTHPNLRLFSFVGVRAVLEAILPHMATPLLCTIIVQLFNEPHLAVPNLSHFMMSTEKPRFSRAFLIFHHKAVVLIAYTHIGAVNYFSLTVPCRHLDWQVSSMAQVFNGLHPLFSEVVELNLDYREHTLSSEWHNQADSMQWRELLGPFRNVKTLRVHNGLIGEVSRSLTLDGEPLLDLLPELNELVCPTGSVDDKSFAPFVREREVAGQQVNLIGETFPVGRVRYMFFSSTGNTYIEPDPDPRL